MSLEAYIILTVTLCCLYISSMVLDTGQPWPIPSRQYTLCLLLCGIIVAIWIGMRPLDSLEQYGDSAYYAQDYMAQIQRPLEMDWHQEWIWEALTIFSRRAGLTVHGFFILVAVMYVGTAICAMRIIIPKGTALALVFLVSSYAFYPYAINGIRQGLACHITLLAIAFVLDGRYFVSAVLSLVAIGIHRSVLLPIACTAICIWVIRNYRIAVGIWIASIVLSVFSQQYFIELIAHLGIDPRLLLYAAGKNGIYTNIGFRWDFLIYSAVPVLIGYYAIVYRGITDTWYTAICSTYCLSNAVWVLMISMAYSNRFAYLSWFLYPVVVAYPLTMFPLWPSKKVAALTLMVYAAFTVIMSAKA